MRFKVQTYSLLILVSLASVACRDTAHPQPSHMKAQTVYFPNRIGQKSVFLQLAIRAEEKAKGLMFRESLATDHGLCFVSDPPQQQSFWMRNTQIPLDLAHFDSQGVLVEIHQLYPYDESPVKSHHLEIRYSIEMNQGWFKRNQIRPGSKLDLDLLQQALAARGSR